MRRILFYIVLVIQACVIIFFVFQFERIDQDGTEIKLVTIEQNEMYDYNFPLKGNAYLEYEITNVSTEKWSGSSELDYNELVYVLLQRDEDGIYQVEEASDAKLVAYDSHSVFVIGQYSYYNKQNKKHRIDYNLQSIDNIEQFGKFTYNDQLIVTLMVAKWNQHKVKDVRVLME